MTNDEQMRRVHAFQVAFGRHVAQEAGIPPLSRADRRILQSYTLELADLGRRLKGEALLANVRKLEALGLMLIRLQLLTEETAELGQALVDGDLVEALDALSDIGYVLNGTYLTLGLQGFKEEADVIVHESNMSKLDERGQPIVDGAGRVVKGPRYQEPKAALKKLLGQ